MKIIDLLRYTPEKEKRFHESRIVGKTGLATLGESMLNDMRVLDSKSSAILNLISLVIAALTFGLSVVDGKDENAEIIRFVFYLFMAVFSLAAAIDIRCVYNMDGDDFPENSSEEDVLKILLHEITLRRRRYGIALQIVRIGVYLLFAFMLVWLIYSYKINMII